MYRVKVGWAQNIDAGQNLKKDKSGSWAKPTLKGMREHTQPEETPGQIIAESLTNDLATIFIQPEWRTSTVCESINSCQVL